MRKLNPLAFLCALALALLAVAQLQAGDTRPRFFDRSVLHVHTGEADIDISAADYTGYQALITIAPIGSHALLDTKVVIDLDKAAGGITTGFADQHTSETITFAVARKVADGYWRTDSEVETTAISGTNAASRSITLDLGAVGPLEQARVMVKVSAEAADTELPYVAYYRAGVAATFTDVAAE